MEGASLITGDGRTVATAKAEANAEMERKSADANWTKALHDATHPGHAAAVAENERLMKIIHG